MFLLRVDREVELQLAIKVISWAHRLIPLPSSTLSTFPFQLPAAQNPGAMQNEKQPVMRLSMAAHPLATGFLQTV